MTRRKYARLNPLPPMVRRPDSPPFVRRCPSGEYEVLNQGVLMQGGFDSFDEATAWIEERKS